MRLRSFVYEPRQTSPSRTSQQVGRPCTRYNQGMDDEPEEKRSRVPSPDVLVKVDAKEPGAPWHVTLGGEGLPEVVLGPYENPATAEQDAAKIRGFLAALLESK